MTLAEGKIGIEYKIIDINTDDEELKSFLFTLGCYKGESITIISMVSNSYVLAIKDGRYNVDVNLAEIIEVR